MPCVPQVGLDRDRRFKQGRFECLVACEPGARRPPLPGSSSAQRTPGAVVPALFKWLVRRELQVCFTSSAVGKQGIVNGHNAGSFRPAAGGRLPSAIPSHCVVG